MIIIKQPDPWSCTAASLTMLLGLDYQDIITDIGHDGSEIWWPEDRIPQRGFSVQEIIDCALKNNYALVPIDGCPGASSDNGTVTKYIFENYEERLLNHMIGREGLILGYYAPNRCHMVAWDGSKIYDPMDARIYSLDTIGVPKISIETFYKAIYYE